MNRDKKVYNAEDPIQGSSTFSKLAKFCPAKNFNSCPNDKKKGACQRAS